jgi:hypothetical protein
MWPNSTLLTHPLRFGKVTYAVESPMTSGVVTAAILVCKRSFFAVVGPALKTITITGDQHDEIDIEILGGDTHHWQVWTGRSSL